MLLGRSYPKDQEHTHRIGKILPECPPAALKVYTGKCCRNSALLVGETLQ